MKHLGLNKILLAAMTILMVACGSKKDQDQVQWPGFPDSGPFIPDGSGPGMSPGVDWDFGATADLTASNSALSNYAGWDVNNPQNLRINLNLRKYNQGFGGVVSIGFEDHGMKFEDTFSSLVNPHGTVKTNEENNKYNIWFNHNGQTVWHGFFQDHFGAIIVVIDEVIDLNDGHGPEDLVGGEVWFKNHPLAFAPLSPTSCWFVSLGPYDCRTWKDGKKVDTTRALYPSPGDGYQRLGRFNNLSLIDGFNKETSF